MVWGPDFSFFFFLILEGYRMIIPYPGYCRSPSKVRMVQHYHVIFLLRSVYGEEYTLSGTEVIYDLMSV